MPLCVPIYEVGNQFTFPRSYVSRIAVLDPNRVNPHFEGSNLIYGFDSLTIIVALQPEFYAWSSNGYTFQYIFDIDNCAALLAGVPQPFGLFMNVRYSTDEGIITPTVRVDNPQDFGTAVALPSGPPDYWLPPSI